MENDSLRRHYLDDVRVQFAKLKSLADRALAQTGDESLFATPDPESNSIAIIVKHMAGNLRSRWTGFLTSDGEKPDRHRDSEFVIGEQDTRARLLEQWEDGWQRLFDALAELKENDLEKTVRIRGERHSVVEAIHRQLTHQAYHVGQLVFLAKLYRPGNWQTLSIPRGKSEEFNASKLGQAGQDSSH